MEKLYAGADWLVAMVHGALCVFIPHTFWPVQRVVKRKAIKDNYVLHCFEKYEQSSLITMTFSPHNLKC